MEYDEFGNLIGGEDDDEDDYEMDGGDDERGGDEDRGDAMEEDRALANLGDADERQITLHEDKVYYPDASKVYPGAATVVLDEDAQPLEEPILKSATIRQFSKLETEVPPKTWSRSFMLGLMEQPTLIRNVALCGGLHSGKTLLLDAFVQYAHRVDWDPSKEYRYSDTREDEQHRQMSIKSCPVSLVLPDSRGKSYMLNLVDCPGHANFSDETTASLRAVDAVVLVVDAIEGVTSAVERVIAAALRERCSISLVVNKVDRLILELKMPPAGAYFKLAHTIGDVNAAIAREWAASALRSFDAAEGKARPPRVSPTDGSVCFASAQHCWCFSLESFARMYCDDQSKNATKREAASHSAAPDAQQSLGGGLFSTVDPREFGKRLWGDLYFHASTRKFSKEPPSRGGGANGEKGGEAQRSFIEFVLEPIYKIYSHVLGEEPRTLSYALAEVGVKLKQEQLTLDAKPLLKVALGAFFRGRTPCAFVDMVSQHAASARDGASAKVEGCYTGDLDGAYATAMKTCDSSATAPLVMNIVKLYSSPDGTEFLSFGRVYSGKVRVGMSVDVLGEAYSQEDTEDARTQVVQGVSVCHGRHRTPVTEAGPGCLVLLEGVDASIHKTATIVPAGASMGTAGDEEHVAIFRPLKFDNAAVVKLAVEPLNPSELPKMTEGLRKISKSYPLCTTKVEESGEHVVMGTGELYMDCVMHDLREMYSAVEVKVADPVVAFCETVVETSSLKCFSETPNKRNKLTMICEPLEPGVADDVEQGFVDPAWTKKKIGAHFQGKYDWDLLAARSIWAFGPDRSASASTGAGCSNLLCDDTLPSEVDKRLLATAKDSIVQGFQWGCREGPLCDEPIRNVKFKILDATISDQPLHRGGGQLIPTSRRVCYSAFLMASPRLMEPVFACEIQCPADCVAAVYPVLQRRRGHIVQDAPKPGAPFYTVKAFIPAIDSFGFETDLRAFTQGQAMVSQYFDHWSVVPGDPLDRSIILHPLEPSPPPHLAREFMVKTRRRKGLSEDVSIAKFFDDPMLKELSEMQPQA